MHSYGKITEDRATPVKVNNEAVIKRRPVAVPTMASPGIGDQDDIVSDHEEHREEVIQQQPTPKQPRVNPFKKLAHSMRNNAAGGPDLADEKRTLKRQMSGDVGAKKRKTVQSRLNFAVPKTATPVKSVQGATAEEKENMEDALPEEPMSEVME